VVGDGPTLDVEALFTAVDRQRRARRIRFRDVASEAGISASTLTRLGYGHRPDVDGLVRLLAWLGTTDLAPFVRPASQTEEHVP
jgi:hypothetical protein